MLKMKDVQRSSKNEINSSQIICTNRAHAVSCILQGSVIKEISLFPYPEETSNLGYLSLPQ